MQRPEKQEEPFFFAPADTKEKNQKNDRPALIKATKFLVSFLFRAGRLLENHRNHHWVGGKNHNGAINRPI